MRHSRTMLVAAATILSVTLAGMANAQGQARARRTPPAGQPGSGSPGGTPAAPGPDGAVNGARNRGPGRDGAGDGMRFGGGSPAAALLRLKGPLALTDDQVKRLEALQGANVPRRNAADELRARADLLDATQGDGNLSAARTAMDRMNKLRTDRAIAQLKLRQDARAVLTAEQKTKLDNFRTMGARRQRMVASGRAQMFGRGEMGARGRGFMAPRGGPGMRQQFGPPMGPPGGRMGPGMGPGMAPRMGPGDGGMMPRMRRGGEMDSAAIHGQDGQLPPN